MNTPLTTAAAQRISASGVDWHHSATLMRAHAEELELRLREKEANAAAMQEALEQYARPDFYLFLLSPMGQKNDPCSKAAAALSGNAGRELLERLRKAEAKANELERLLNTPEIHDFAKAVALEAAHQVQRWGTEHDAGKTPWDWFWLVGYLAQKAAQCQTEGNTDKALHHCITTAAAMANWHAQILGKCNMRPGIDPKENK